MKKQIISLALAVVIIILVAPAFDIGIIAGAAETNKFLAPIEPPIAGSIPISNREQLEAIKNDLSGNYHLTNDIDLSGANWEPIGNYGINNQFRGIFDGQGYAILNLKILGGNYMGGGYTNDKCGGLFGISNGTIKNVALENADITIQYSVVEPLAAYVGGICGFLQGGGAISNCYNTGTITSNHLTGGICGYSGIISNCYNAGDVRGNYGVGGICGSYGIITNCYNTGNINASTNHFGGVANAGGICGSSADISRCYNTGSVTASTGGLYPVSVGGICGANSGARRTINDCFNIGNVFAFGSSSNSYSGGISGANSSDSVINNCYNTGEISGYDNKIGAVTGVGYEDIKNTYWNIDSKQAADTVELSSTFKKGVGDGTDTTIPLTSEQMKNQSFFVGFDFGNIWDIYPTINSGYPYLKNIYRDNGHTEPPEDLFTALFNKKTSSAYNHGLAKAALELSYSAYSEKEIIKKLESMGCDKDKIEPHYDHDDKDALDYVYHAFGHQTVRINGIAYNLVVVAIRGTRDGAEWASNILLGGFHLATIAVSANLTDYLDREIDSNLPLKLFITGHSRGGAVANILSAWLIDNGTVTTDNLYTYTFATPNTRDLFEKNGSSYDSIINICNKEDVAPGYPPFCAKYGKTLWFSRKWNENVAKNYKIITGDDLNEIMSFNYKITDEAVAYVANKKKIAHCTEFYKAWLMCFDDDAPVDIYDKKYNAKIGCVWCPVDVEIYDDSTLIGQIINNQITLESTLDINICVDGDKKYFWMPADKNYTVKLIGNDSGIMTYFITDKDMVTGEIGKEKLFENVALTSGKKFISDIVSDTPDIQLFVQENGANISEVMGDGSEVAITSSSTTVQSTSNASTIASTNSSAVIATTPTTTTTTTASAAITATTAPAVPPQFTTIYGKSGVTLRSTPSITGADWGKVALNTELLLLTQTTDYNGNVWYMVKVPDGRSGWLYGLDVSFFPIAKPDYITIWAKSTVILRSTASASSKNWGAVAKGTSLILCTQTVDANGNVWYMVKTPDGRSGWMIGTAVTFFPM